MIISGTPALFKVGIIDILFGTVWKPEAAVPAFGILYVILTSIAGTALAILIGVPIGVMTAVFLAEVAPPGWQGSYVRQWNCWRIPSVIYGLLGILILNPLMYKLELKIFEGSTTHQFTGGANLISAVLVLALMILPTVINISESALRSVPKELRSASGSGSHKDSDDFPGCTSSSKIRYYNSHRSGHRPRHRRSHGDQPCIGKLRSISASLQLRPLPYDGDRIGNVLLGGSSQTGALYHWSCPVRIYYDH